MVCPDQTIGSDTDCFAMDPSGQLLMVSHNINIVLNLIACVTYPSAIKPNDFPRYEFISINFSTRIVLAGKYNLHVVYLFWRWTFFTRIEPHKPIIFLIIYYMYR